jgi:hypothetical protein
MHNTLFVLSMALFLIPVFVWSFRALPGERWQIICAIPVRKRSDGSWQGLNLTYYGLFNAIALSSGIALVFVLTGAAAVDVRLFAVTVVILLSICLPASKIIARVVEKKKNTFSVGAASFLGIILGPWLVLMIETIARQTMDVGFNVMAVMSSLMVGYALGEGIGRLACISFGCCYGRPIDQMPPFMRRYFSWATFTYTGCTKKIAYAHHLEGQRIFAIQAVTSVLYTASALVGTLLVLNGDHAWAYFVCLFITQGWRFLSEFLRADYRGDRRISVYQIMSLLTIPYGLLLPFVFPTSGHAADLQAGLQLLWNPAVILFLQAVGIVMFLRTGRSQVTGSGVSFHVKHDQI